jgi:aldose 1-epimerase
MSKNTVILCAGSAEFEIWPAAGGSITRWTIDGQEMFRRTTAETLSESAPSPLSLASFPLVPYSNRIGFGRFEWDGEPVQLAANFLPEPHSIHGTGWTTQWEAEQLSDSEIILHLAHEPNAHWPWRFKAEQHLSLSAETLSIKLMASNLSDQSVPLAFGHHPYFDKQGATLFFNADSIWRTGDDGLPASAEALQGNYDFANGNPVQGRALDNGFAGWDGKAFVRWEGRPLKLEIEADMAAAVVYVPDREDYFCFEPVPHIINALNLPGQQPPMPVVAPGSSYEAQIRFVAKPA